MIHLSDVGQTIEYRGHALGVFPRGIKHVDLLLVSLSGDAAFLQGADGRLFGVLAIDCSTPLTLSSQAIPDFSPTLLHPLPDFLPCNSNRLEPRLASSDFSVPPRAPLSERILVLRASTLAILQGALEPKTDATSFDSQAVRPPLAHDPSDPHHFVIRPMPSEIPDWSVEPVVDRFKSQRSARADSRRNTP